MTLSMSVCIYKYIHVDVDIVMPMKSHSDLLKTITKKR